ncbi:OprD family outer membrane porin [Acinetobacter sp. MD2(2019)]|uniref:OprD family outer membrane porin n=1 Tax=Acinetobacter sp. MD2(2019) TaxID=2605273 RepID=UPI002D1F5457|nr:OprD family outer membrane porin [Acinetobacter sp. MD2(2019)]MEB3753295.1 outer membrane porin, OprD family [Acinetobacter sp. MD2(2019)]
MLNLPKLPLVLLIQALLVSPAFASEQSESKGLVDDASASVLLRTGFIDRDKKNVNPGDDTRSSVQSVMLNAETGFTQGTVGFAAGVVGDFSFKLGDNKHSGNNMVPRDSNGNPYDQWTRGGAYAKVRASNTTLTYGTQILDIPVLASNTARMVPEYFTGTLLTSHEVKDLEVIAGKFTKNQMSDQISTDKDASGNSLKRAYVWGAKYKFNDQFNASYYGLDSKDKLDRHYADLNYKLPLADKNSLTFDLSGYHTKWDKDAGASSAKADVNPSDRSNNIWAFSTTYNQGPHSVMLAYQQSTGNTGYAYGENADGFQSIYLPNSYLSDFNGRGEKSAQVQYSVDFSDYGVPGLSWTSAYVYGWDIDTKTTSNAKEREFFNQVKYTVQSGFAKGASLRLRESIYRTDSAYSNDYYMPSTNETRIFLDIPVKFF